MVKCKLDLTNSYYPHAQKNGHGTYTKQDQLNVLKHVPQNLRTLEAQNYITLITQNRCHQIYNVCNVLKLKDIG
jgi:hypothetical protein